ncbi:MAG: ABC transporter substrate-binding protein [Beijerinckiaceae bacterium]|jgi:branched-chain amino acid transport system substrate-binding protein|nr:ABC transporter substrate-binding protein [Beijerinckiaceae bacterium]
MRSKNTIARILLAAGLSVAASSAMAADTVKIGFVTTLTTGGAVIGQEMKNAVELALETIGHKMGGKKVEVIFEDDGFKPETAKQKTDKLIKQDKVDFLAGYIWSHVLMASRKSALDSGKFLISSNAGASAMAGRLCHKNFFSASWVNDQIPMALGDVLNKKGVQSLYVMAPNYAAGKDMVSGLKRTFKGKILGTDFTKWGKDAQLDFSAELAKAKASGAKGIFVFYPGAAGGAFIRQYAQAGLQGTIPLYSVFTTDAISLPKLQQANLTGVLGSEDTLFWSPDLDNPANKKFVAAYKKKFGKLPAFYAAQTWDTIMLIKSAVDAVKGDMSKMDEMRAEMKKANFDSIRGKFTYGKNHLPIQNFYLRRVEKDSDGTWVTKIVDTVYKNHQDPFASQCKM